jgi:hypothetical protein
MLARRSNGELSIELLIRVSFLGWGWAEQNLGFRTVIVLANGVSFYSPPGPWVESAQARPNARIGKDASHWPGVEAVRPTPLESRTKPMLSPRPPVGDCICQSGIQARGRRPAGTRQKSGMFLPKGNCFIELKSRARFAALNLLSTVADWLAAAISGRGSGVSPSGWRVPSR